MLSMFSVRFQKSLFHNNSKISSCGGKAYSFGESNWTQLNLKLSTSIGDKSRSWCSSGICPNSVESFSLICTAWVHVRGWKQGNFNVKDWPNQMDYSTSTWSNGIFLVSKYQIETIIRKFVFVFCFWPI